MPLQVVAASRRRGVSDIMCTRKSQEVWFTRLVTGVPAVQREISFSLVLVKSFIDLASMASPLVASCIVRYKRMRTTNHRKGGFVRTPRTPPGYTLAAISDTHGFLVILTRGFSKNASVPEIWPKKANMQIFQLACSRSRAVSRPAWRRTYFTD